MINDFRVDHFQTKPNLQRLGRTLFDAVTIQGVRRANWLRNQKPDLSQTTTIYIHTYIHTYILTYILTYLHTYILTYLHTSILAYLHTCILAYLHTCIHAYMHTCIHAYRHTCILTSWNIYIYIIIFLQCTYIICRYAIILSSHIFPCRELPGGGQGEGFQRWNPWDSGMD